MSEPGKFQTGRPLENLNQKGATDVSAPGNGINIWVIIGYISSLFGGLFGIFIGSVIITAKKILPGGPVIYVFNERNRKHGKIILYLSSIILVLSILFFMNWFFLEKILFGKR
ncbi:MAG: hypothetical protein ACHQF0_06275 [Chitinophagales bacterium]